MKLIKRQNYNKSQLGSFPTEAPESGILLGGEIQYRGDPSIYKITTKEERLIALVSDESQGYILLRTIRPSTQPNRAAEDV